MLVLPFTARVWLHRSSQSRIYTDINKIPACKVALVLGCKINPNGSPSVFMKDRLDAAIDLYKAGKAEKLLMSGDNRFSHYNEPQHMHDYAIRHGVPAKDIAMDFAGRRTYDSIYRAKHIFGQDSFIVVSQGWHDDRAIYLADHMGIQAYGLATDKHRKLQAEFRETFASLSAIIDVHIRHPRPVMGKREEI